MATDYASFADFYPHYLREHQNRTNRRLHFVGTTVTLLLLVGIVAIANWPLLLALPVTAYGPAWVGHFYFERNRPATFQHPLYSLRGDLRMYAETWAGRIPF
ncbi:MAG: DUF962 domain-containing protein [Gammaproteobacteria bacterium]